MHSCMRDKYHFRNNLANSTIFLSSIILNAFVFVDPQVFSAIGLTPKFGTFVIGLTSILIFFASILLLVFKWEEKSEKHESAKNQLYSLLEEIREYLALESIDEAIENDFEKKKAKILSQLIPIPENQFRRLKHKHYQKIAFSKFIDDNHKLPYFIVKIKFWLNK